ncbi:Capsular polysaccharide phosphotransferase SacB [Brevibacterium casei]|uniref:Capsular polysaccharide phosphotransferase SacB n=1 Tax=Brevibacterium casei TaxID=33889 RepID=A0A269ZJZ1_9MICO|nr:MULTISPECIES: stealth conserved region 3 domain-containing protein [Brevibacterium]MCM1013140.1 stealth family protein [Brevibacterium sp. XM4083]PAK97336.1 hypothetical protein B8X04_01800 [Brevibacterium casei]VEW10883.1 Capsular polysaccharide phosphotransferase SacB [Brevibacterium casei]
MNGLKSKVNTVVGGFRRTMVDALSDQQKLLLSEVRHGETEWQQRVRSTVRNRSPRSSDAVAHQAHDSRAARAENLAQVRAILAAAQVDFVELPRRSREKTRLVVPRSQIRRVLAAVARLTPENGWAKVFRDQFSSSIGLQKMRHDPGVVAAIECRRLAAAPDGRRLNTENETIIVEAWADLGPREPRVDGSWHVPGTLHRVLTQPRTLVEYFTPADWAASLANGNRTAQPSAPDLYEIDGPVDLVYTWVNGSDPTWLWKKLQAQAALTGETINKSAVSDSRFADRKELLYSLRSVESYASWANHIYLVTDDQVPDWLNVDHPKLTVIDHRDIFTEPGNLPVFNSHAIESQLHHIPGLSENYVYMNDDLFFMRPTEPDLFFTGSGLSRFFPSTAPLDLAEPTARDLPVLSAAKHGRQFMLDEHGRRVGNKFKHTPHPQLKSVMTEFEESHQDLFDSVARSKFRHPDDYSIASALYHFHAYAQGRAIDSGIRYAYMDISRPDAELYMRRLLRRRDLDVLCLNDTDSSPDMQDHLDEIVRWFLDEKFPLPSTFEK